jgi:hypothetical protein
LAHRAGIFLSHETTAKPNPSPPPWTPEDNVAYIMYTVCSVCASVYMIVFSIVNTEQEKLFPSSSNLSAMKYKKVVEKILKK